MARFELELPNELMKDLEKVYNNSDSIFGGMTRAGAEVVEKNILATMPDAIKKSEMIKCLRITKTYKTPSDGGINTKVGFYGYFNNKDGRETPAPLVASVYEHGRSTSDYPKQPFMRSAFKKKEIEEAMLKAQEKLSGGLLT